MSRGDPAAPRRALALGLLSLLGLMAFPGCSRPAVQGLDPVPVQVDFLGKVRLFASPGAPPAPRYLQGDALQLRFKPAPPTEGQCDPFAAGRLSLKLDDAPSFSFQLEPGSLEPVGAFYLLKALPQQALSSPVPAADASTPVSASLVASGSPGLHHLTLRWTCASPDPDVLPTVRQTVHPFWIHAPPEQSSSLSPLWNRLKAVESLPAAQRLPLAVEILKEAQSAEDRLWLSRGVLRAAMEAGDFEQAEAVALERVKLAEQAGFPSEAVMAWNAAHEAARDQGRLSNALVYLERSTRLAEELGFVVRLPIEAYSRAWVLERSGRALEALETADLAQRLAEELGNAFFAREAELLRLNLLQALGHHRLVNRRLLELAAEPSQSPEMLNNVAWSLAQALAAGVPPAGDVDSTYRLAESLYQRAFEAYHQQGDIPRAAHVKVNLAGLAVSRGRADDAVQFLQDVEALKVASDPVLNLYLQQVRAQCALLQGHAREALLKFEALEAAAGEQSLVEYAAEAAAGAGAAQEHLGRLDAAVAAYDRALDWVEEDEAVRSPLHQATLLGSRVRWEAEAVRLKLKQNKLVAALDQVERSSWARWRSLVRAGRQNRLEPEQNRQLELDRGELDRLDRELARLQRSATPARRQRLVELENERARRWASMQMRLDDTSIQPTLDIARIQSRLDSDTVLLRFALYPTRLVTWQLTRTSLKVRATPVARLDLELLVEAFTRACRTGDLSSQEGARLSTLLLNDIPPTTRQLVVVAEGSLRNLPWTALPLGEGVLLDRVQVSVVPGLLWDPAETRVETRLVVADPERNLPEAAREGQEVATLLGGARLLLREAASREAVLPALESAGVFHYAGHGAIDVERPYLSNLRLTDGRRLSLMELSGLRLPGTRVFLNACSSGAVAVEAGSLGLADGFLAAGAREVTAGLWEVPDRVGVLAASTYYRALKAEDSAAAALHFTLREMRAGRLGADAARADAWSAYVVLGWP